MQALTAHRYRYNENIQALEVDPRHLAEGVAHAAREGHGALRIYELNQPGATVDLDLAPLAGAGHVRSLSISDSFKPGKVSLEGLYDMPALKELAFQDQKIRPDLARLPQLEVLYAAWSKGLAGFDALTRLRDLLVTGLGEADCSLLAGLAALERLRVSGGTVASLHGVEGLERLAEVKLDHCAKLADATALAQLPALRRLHVEKCKLLHDFSWLAGAEALDDLFVSELDSIAFVPKMKGLRALKFWDLADGDVEPALASGTLRKIDFFPDRKHYTRTKAQAVAALAERA